MAALSAVKQLCMRPHSFVAAASTTRLYSKDYKHAKYFPANKAPMLPPDAFKRKVAFVTGGGTGLGRAMSEMLSGLGAQVTIVGRRLDVLQKTADEISAKSGNKVLAVSCDIRDPLAVKEAVSECVLNFGLPNVVINNAAGNFICPTERLSANAWKTVVDIVLNGTANVTTDIGRRLIDAKQGAAFVSITTTYTQSGSGFVAPSAAAKAGVEALCMSLASEWARYGIRFNCIAPGPIETEGAFSRLDPTGQYREDFVKRVAVGRFGEKEELANLACYLASDYSNWMTGSIIKFDGGEFNNMAGEFNRLKEVSEQEWDMLDAMVKARKHKK